MTHFNQAQVKLLRGEATTVVLKLARCLPPDDTKYTVTCELLNDAGQVVDMCTVTEARQLTVAVNELSRAASVLETSLHRQLIHLEPSA
jgi:hypothetical protein